MAGLSNRSDGTPSLRNSAIALNEPLTIRRQQILTSFVELPRTGFGLSAGSNTCLKTVTFALPHTNCGCRAPKQLPPWASWHCTI